MVTVDVVASSMMVISIWGGGDVGDEGGVVGGRQAVSECVLGDGGDGVGGAGVRTAGAVCWTL